jgi:hypothetical protein
LDAHQVESYTAEAHMLCLCAASLQFFLASSQLGVVHPHRVGRNVGQQTLYAQAKGLKPKMQGRVGMMWLKLRAHKCWEDCQEKYQHRFLVGPNMDQMSHETLAAETWLK